MNPSNLSLRQKSRGTVVKTIAIHLYGARDPNYIVDLTLSWVQPQSVCDCLLSTEEQTGVSEVTVSDVGSADGRSRDVGYR